MKIFYLLMGSSGEYSERMEWPVALYDSEAAAQGAAERATVHARENEARRSHWLKMIYNTWYQTIYNPWYQRIKNPTSGPDAPECPDMPIEPKWPVNPDDPENGHGDTYWVVAVPLRSSAETCEAGAADAAATGERDGLSGGMPAATLDFEELMRRG